MAEFFLELFSEEIPARMQARAAEDLARLFTEALAPLAPADVLTFSGPRRLALAATVSAEVAESRIIERGPRRTAPEQALAGFLRKHNASREQLREEGDFLVLEKVSAGVDAASLIARELPALLRRFPWPKSMRWGGTSAFTWVRPLRRITCLLDGMVVPFDLRDGPDDGHGLTSSNVTEGHRFLSPGEVEIGSFAEWRAALAAHHVIADAAERRALVADGIAEVAAMRQLKVVDDPGLVDEVAGLVEWPVPMLGRIDDAYMDLPAEVMQVSMRVNQRYFALRDAAGNAAPWFAFVANITARDGGAAIVAGNERVLRARFSDARHFWDLDRQRTLESRVAALDGVTFHAKLGSQGDRVRRIVHLADMIAPMVDADVANARRAATLAKADLTTGMVGEFPELQGVIGRYYAKNDNEHPDVADAVRDHYSPNGLDDKVPFTPVTVAVALADKLDQIVSFFDIGEKPTGSGDPFALRRAALGIIRIIINDQISIPILQLIGAARRLHSGSGEVHLNDEVFVFMLDRLRIKIRVEGGRVDVFDAVFSVFSEPDIAMAYFRYTDVRITLERPDGVNLMVAYRRTSNILRKELKHDGPHKGVVDEILLTETAEIALLAALRSVNSKLPTMIFQQEAGNAMALLATLRAPLDAFFEDVTVNDTRPEIRANRLRLLSRVLATMNSVADFSKIEG